MEFLKSVLFENCLAEDFFTLARVHQIGWNMLGQLFLTIWLTSVWSVTTFEVGGIVDQMVQEKQRIQGKIEGGTVLV